MSSNRVLASGRAGKPMAVQHHADIIAVSYEARELGVTKHMPIGFIHQQYPSVKLVHVQVTNLFHGNIYQVLLSPVQPVLGGVHVRIHIRRGISVFETCASLAPRS